jgi:hypothetical protein
MDELLERSIVHFGAVGCEYVALEEPYRDGKEFPNETRAMSVDATNDP